MIKVIEFFAGIGAYHQALKELEIPHEIVGISEIDNQAISAYQELHGQVNSLGDIRITLCRYVVLFFLVFQWLGK